MDEMQVIFFHEHSQKVSIILYLLAALPAKLYKIFIKLVWIIQGA
jgi:hypothetical protein